MIRRNLVLSGLLVFCATIALLAASILSAQNRIPIAPPNMQTRDEGTGEQLRDEQLRRMHKQRVTDRHNRIKKDTEQLLALAQELKSSVDKTNENILSLEVIRKAEQIEKLAKDVKTRMRESVDAPGIR